VIRKPEHFKAVLFQPAGSSLVVSHAQLRPVLIAVKLNDEPHFKTHKVSNVWSDWLLSAEFETGELSAAQRGP
jgi:hypothetical protein